MTILIIFLLILSLILSLIICYCNYRKSNFISNIDTYEIKKDILILCPVLDENRFIQLWNKNYEIIKQWKIDIVFVHFDLKVDNWKKLFNYYNEDNVKHIITDGCKSKHWKYLSPLYTNEYEYIWLIDGDMNLKDWNWDIYRSYLKPDDYVSQPAIIQNDPSHNMFYKKLKYIPGKKITKTNLIEQQACLIKRDLWNAMYNKVLYSNNYTSWEIEWYWNEIANKLKNGFEIKNGKKLKDLNNIDNGELLVVHESPVIHENFKTIQIGDNKCKRKLITSEDTEIVDNIINRLKK